MPIHLIIKRIEPCEDTMLLGETHNMESLHERER